MSYTKLIRINTIMMLFVIIIGLYTGVANAHGNISLEQDSCIRGTQGSMVHLSTYQPQNEPTAQYCTEIPTEGETYFVVDLIDSALRNMPVAMKIVRGTSETDETVSFLRADYHPDGVIGSKANLNQGNYTVFITGEGAPPVMRYQYPLRVQQINYVNLIRSAAGPLIASLLLMLLGYKFARSKRVQNWLASRRN